MYYEIYIDSLFFINFLMDLLVLWTLCKLFKQTSTRLKLFVGATVGSFMVCLLVIVPIRNVFFSFLIAYVISCLAMIFIAFRPKNIKQLLKLLIGLYVIAFTIGGSILALYYYTSFGYYFTQFMNGKNIGIMDIKTLILSSGIAFISIKLIYKYFNKVMIVQKNVFKTELLLKGNKVDTLGFIDTGNNLYDPITNTPVVIVEYDVIKDVVPNTFQQVFQDYIDNNLESFYSKLAEISEYKIRLIPFNSLGQEKGMLLGLVSDGLNINLGEEKSIKLKDAVIALYNNKLSNDNSYQLLLHPSLIETK